MGAYMGLAIGKALEGANQAFKENDERLMKNEKFGMEKEILGLKRDTAKLELEDAKRRDTINRIEQDHKLYVAKVKPMLSRFVQSGGLDYQPLVDAINTNSKTGYIWSVEHTLNPNTGEPVYDIYVTDPSGNKAPFKKSATMDDVGGFVLHSTRPDEYLQSRLEAARQAAAEKSKREFELKKIDRQGEWDVRKELAGKSGKQSEASLKIQKMIQSQANRLYGELGKNDMVLFEGNRGAYSQFVQDYAWTINKGNEDTVIQDTTEAFNVVKDVIKKAKLQAESEGLSKFESDDRVYALVRDEISQRIKEANEVKTGFRLTKEQRESRKAKIEKDPDAYYNYLTKKKGVSKEDAIKKMREYGVDYSPDDVSGGNEDENNSIDSDGKNTASNKKKRKRNYVTNTYGEIVVNRDDVIRRTKEREELRGKLKQIIRNEQYEEFTPDVQKKIFTGSAGRGTRKTIYETLSDSDKETVRKLIAKYNKHHGVGVKRDKMVASNG